LWPARHALRRTLHRCHDIEEPGRLVDFIASSLPSLSTSDKQETLETTDVRTRLEKINQHLAKELEVQQLRNKIQSEVQDRVQQDAACSTTFANR